MTTTTPDELNKLRGLISFNVVRATYPSLNAIEPYNSFSLAGYVTLRVNTSKIARSIETKYARERRRQKIIDAAEFLP